MKYNKYIGLFFTTYRNEWVSARTCGWQKLLCAFDEVWFSYNRIHIINNSGAAQNTAPALNSIQFSISVNTIQMLSSRPGYHKTKHINYCRLWSVLSDLSYLLDRNEQYSNSYKSGEMHLLQKSISMSFGATGIRHS